ncbi:MAG: acetyl-CoA decarbonylase/synthase complex subunit delta, partial [Anaerolineae bacterium]|nr:acetyl-CoA decarbonylase/synthase complex subunit delta [Anaerolineae bacterium]
MSLELVTEKWSGQVREITLGATKAQGGTRTRTVTIGGESTLPFLTFEGQTPHPPAFAIEIADRPPADWSPLLLEAWGDVVKDPAAWAKAAEELGADLIVLHFMAPEGSNGHGSLGAHARATVRRVLQATGLPLIVFGPGQPEADNEILMAVAEEAKGE